MSPASRRSTGRPRRAVVLASIAIAATTLTACAAPKTGGADSGPVTLNVMINAGHDYKAYQSVIAAFEKKHHVTVNVQKYQWGDLQTKLVAGFRSGDVPDLVEEAGPGTAVQYGVQGNVLPLDTYIKRDGAAMKYPDDFQSTAVDARTYKGKTYSIPLHLSAAGILYYNKGLLKEAGYDKPPATWDQLKQVAKDTTKNGVYGLAVTNDPIFDTFLLQGGARLTDVASDKVLTPSSDATKSLTFLQDLVFTDKVAQPPVASSDYAGPQKLFSSGRAAMFMSGPWDLLPVREGSGDIDWGVAPPLKGKVQASALTGSGLMIPKKAKHPGLAWDLIKDLTTLKVELAATKESGITMPRKSWAASPQIADDPTMSVVAKTLSVAVAPDSALAAAGKNDQINDLWRAAYQKIVIQDAPVKQTMDQFRTSALGIIK